MSISKGQRNYYAAKRVFISISKVQESCSKSPAPSVRSSQRLEPVRCQTPDIRGKSIRQTPSRASPISVPRHVKVDLSCENLVAASLELRKTNKGRSVRPSNNYIDLRRGSFSKKQITTSAMQNNWVGNRLDNMSSQFPSRSPSPAISGRTSKLKELSTNFRLEKAMLGSSSNKRAAAKCSDNKENIEKVESTPWEGFISDLENISKILPVRSRRPSRR